MKAYVEFYRISDCLPYQAAATPYLSRPYIAPDKDATKALEWLEVEARRIHAENMEKGLAEWGEMAILRIGNRQRKRYFYQPIP